MTADAIRRDQIRQARAGAITRLNRMLTDDFSAARAQLLDELERIDREHPASGEPVTVQRADDVPSDDELTAWIKAHPGELEAWVRKQARINGAPPPFDAPAPRRRTTRKADG